MPGVPARKASDVGSMRAASAREALLERTGTPVTGPVAYLLAPQLGRIAGDEAAPAPACPSRRMQRWRWHSMVRQADPIDGYAIRSRACCPVTLRVLDPVVNGWREL